MREKQEKNYISARFASRESLNQFYPLKDAAMGGFRIGDIELSAHDRKQQILVMGGTGAGKGVCLMTPNLIRDLLSPASNVFTDKKHPETYRTLSRVHDTLRRTRSDYDRLFIAFAPFDPDNTVTWNPIDGIVTFGEATTWADIILNNSSSEEINGVSGGAEFYRNNEQSLLRSLIRWVNNTTYRAARHNNLATILRILNLKQSKEGKRSHMRDLLTQPQFVLEDETRFGKLRPAWEMIEDDIGDLFELEDRDLRGIIKGLKNRLKLFRDPRVAAATAYSEIDLGRIGREPVTLILGVPSQEEESSRLITALFLEGLVKHLRHTATASPENRCPVDVSIYLDEAGNLGRIPLPAWLSELRSYGVGLICVFQDRGQILRLFGKDGESSIMTNCQTQIVFYNCGSDAGKYYSEKLGKALIEKTVKGRSVSSAGFIGVSRTTKSETPRETLFPLMDTHAVEKMLFDGVIGIEYEQTRLGRPILDEQGRNTLKRVRAMVFLYKTMPALVWLYPYWQFPSLRTLIDRGEVHALRKPLGVLKALDLEELFRWNLAGSSGQQGAAQAKVNPPRPGVSAGKAPGARPGKAWQAPVSVPPVADPAVVPPAAVPTVSEQPDNVVPLDSKKRRSTPPKAGPSTAAPAASPPYPASAKCPICDDEQALKLKRNVMKNSWDYHCTNNLKHTFPADELIPNTE